jgi:hypothetical protein
MMVEITTRDGIVRVPHTRIVSVYEAGTSSQWHGTRAIVKVDGERWPIKSTDDAQTIANRCHAAMKVGGER